MTDHYCHAKGCRRLVEREKLMCRTHWYMVPLDVRTEVLQTYVRGQCEMNPRPSEAWHKAAEAAVNAVAKLEGR